MRGFMKVNYGITTRRTILQLLEMIVYKEFFKTHENANGFNAEQKIKSWIQNRTYMFLDHVKNHVVFFLKGGKNKYPKNVKSSCFCMWDYGEFSLIFKNSLLNSTFSTMGI